jgi:serine/threonine protein kinase
MQHRAGGGGRGGRGGRRGEGERALRCSALGTNHQVSKDLKDLLERLLDKDPKRRVALVEAASHDWVVGSTTSDQESK